MINCSPKVTSDGLEIGGGTAFFWVAILKLIFLMNSCNSVIRVMRFCLNRLIDLFIGLDPAGRVSIIGKKLLPLSSLFILSTTLS